MKAKATSDAAENVRDVTSATASLVRELETVPIAGANTFAELLSTFRIEYNLGRSVGSTDLTASTLIAGGATVAKTERRPDQRDEQEVVVTEEDGAGRNDPRHYRHKQDLLGVPPVTQAADQWSHQNARQQSGGAHCRHLIRRHMELVGAPVDTAGRPVVR